MRGWRLLLVAGAGVLAAVAGSVLAVALNVDTGGSARWFPTMGRYPLWWTGGATAGVAGAGLLVWWAQRWYDRGMAELVPAVQRPAPWVVDRPAEVAQVTAALRGGRTAGVTTAVLGAPGVGKTTIAKMVRCDGRMLRQFRGRVYWVTVGRDTTGDALALLVNGLITRIDPGRALTAPDAVQATEQLAAVLAEGPKRLLVLDDVWTDEQLVAFPLAGCCARLVTTRNPSLSGGAAVVPVRVDQMSDKQALALLQAGLPPLPKDIAAALVAETGRWPLLLRLANRALADQVKLNPDVDAAAKRLLGRLREGGKLSMGSPVGTVVRQLDAADPVQRSKSVRATIEASTGLLSPADRGRLAELAVFARDEAIPVSLINVLWRASGGLDEIDVGGLCARLADLALLTLAPAADGGTIAMHDVIRDYQRQELGADRLEQLHQLLLDRTAKGLPAAAAGVGPSVVTAWWELPERARYLREHLIKHMLAAGRDGQAEATATDLRWADSRLRASGPAAPYADLTLIGTTKTERLRRVLGQAAHLLAPTAPPHSQADILFSRISRDPDWGPQAGALQSATTHPALIPALPLPDLPDPALRRTLTGHDHEITALTIAPDSTWLTTASDYDRSVLIWDAATGQQRATLTGHDGGVAAVAIAPDGTWLATGGTSDGLVLIWDAETWQLRATFTGHDGGVAAVAIAPDGTWLATGGWDGLVRTWNAETWQLRANLAGHEHGHRDSVRQVAIAPDGTWLATASRYDRSVLIWDAETAELRATLTGYGHDHDVAALAISPDGTWLATASGTDNSVLIWDAVTWQQRPPLAGTGPDVWAAAISPNGNWLVTVSGGDGAILIWDTATGRLRAALTSRPRGASLVAVAPDATWLATATGQDGSVLIWDAENLQFSYTPDSYDRMKAVAVAPDGTWLVTASMPVGSIQIWDAITGELRAIPANHFGASLMAVAPDGSWLATGGTSDGLVLIWDAVTGKMRSTLVGHDGGVAAVAIAPDGTWLATAARDGLVRTWDTATGQQRATLASHDREVRAIAITPDGTWLVTASSWQDGSVLIWDAVTGKLRSTLADHDGGVAAVAISPDGTWLATAARDGLVRTWDTATGQQRATLAGHDREVRAMASSPDSTWLATVGRDKTLRVWEQATGYPRAVMRVDGSLEACAWSQSGMFIAAVGNTGFYYFRFRP